MSSLIVAFRQHCVKVVRRENVECYHHSNATCRLQRVEYRQEIECTSTNLVSPSQPVLNSSKTNRSPPDDHCIRALVVDRNQWRVSSVAHPAVQGDRQYTLGQLTVAARSFGSSLATSAPGPRSGMVVVMTVMRPPLSACSNNA